MAITKEQQQSIQNLKVIKQYFSNQSKDNFKPELEVSTKIIDYISDKSDFTHEGFLKIEDYYNVIITQEHYNGSGWLDFKIRLNYFLNTFSYKADWDKTNDKLTITKK